MYSHLLYRKLIHNHQPALNLAAMLVLSLWSAVSVWAQTSQSPSSKEWEQWFYEQRQYGLGYIPEDALVKAVDQRDNPATRVFARYLSLSPTITDPTRWFVLGPTGINTANFGAVSGRISSIAIDPRNPSTLYVAAAGGGVWKSSNKGGRWSPISDHLPSLASGAVAVDPFSGEVWYGTGELNFCRDCYYGAGVYRSPDAGSNWRRVNEQSFLSTPTSLIAFDPRNQGTVFIGRATALWKSSDNGQTWHAVLQGVITDFVFHPLDSSIVYAAIGNYNGRAENGIYRSLDGGLTWSRLSSGLPTQSSMGRIALAVSQTSPSTVYALIARSDDFNLNGLYRSLDSGGNWEKVGSVPSDLFLEDGRGQGLFNMLVEVDPRNDAILYVGGVALWKSSNHGATWENISLAARLPEDPRDIVFDPSDAQTFYLTGDSGVWRSSDGGRTFANLNGSLSITQFQSVGLHPTNPNLSVGGTQDNGTTLYSGSWIWEQGRPGDSGAAFFDQSDPSVIYTVANRTSVRRSSDGGKTFQLMDNGIDASDRVQFYPPFIPDPSRPGTLYLGTYRIWRSLDRGDHWSPISGDLTSGGSATLTALAVAPSDSQVLYAGTSTGQIQVSFDGGQTWRLSPSLPNRFVTSIAVQPQSPTVAFAGLSGFGSGHIFRTDDGGRQWVDISSNLPDIPVNVVLVDATRPDRVYLGTDIGVFQLGLDGQWNALTQGLPNTVVLGLSQNATTGLLVAATHGRGAFGLAFGGAAATAPRITTMLNSAGFENNPPAPGMITALFGFNLSEVSTQSFTFPLPTDVLGASVIVNGIPAPLFFVSPTQISFQMPFEVTGDWAAVLLRAVNGEASLRVRLNAASPGIFQDGSGVSLYHGNGSRVSIASPARGGEQVVLLASGLGPVSPSLPSGLPAPSSPLSKTSALPIVRVAGQNAEVAFSGLAPGTVGLYQINFVIPSGLSGAVPLVLDIAGIRSNAPLIDVVP